MTTTSNAVEHGTPQPNKLLTIHEVADLVGISVDDPILTGCYADTLGPRRVRLAGGPPLLLSTISSGGPRSLTSHCARRAHQ